MKHLNLRRIILSLVLVGALLSVSMPAQAATTQATVVSTDLFVPELTPTFDPMAVLRSSVNIAETHTWAFTGRSTPELIIPQMDADTISLKATCEGDEIDNIIFTIQGNEDDNADFGKNIPFPADGNVHTFAYSISAGIYKANFSGDSSIRKTYAQAVLTVID